MKPILLILLLVVTSCQTNLTYYKSKYDAAHDSLEYYNKQAGMCCDSVWQANYTQEKKWLDSERLYRDSISTE